MAAADSPSSPRLSIDSHNFRLSARLTPGWRVLRSRFGRVEGGEWFDSSGDIGSCSDRGSAGVKVRGSCEKTTRLPVKLIVLECLGPAVARLEGEGDLRLPQRRLGDDHAVGDLLRRLEFLIAHLADRLGEGP